MGLLSMFGSASRVVGPIFVSYIYKYYGTYWTMGSMAISMIISLVLIATMFKRMIPIQIGSSSIGSELNQDGIEEDHL